MNKNTLTQLGIVLISSLVFLPFLGNVHLFDWDEINFAESAREMIATGDYLTVRINFTPFWEKPPLFILMQVLSMKIFGVNEYAARFPNAVCGIASLLLLYRIGARLYDNKFGLLWVLAYAGSVLPFLYFKSGIIDPWFNLFIILGVVHFVYYTDISAPTKKARDIALSALFIGLAILTKGPVALLVFLLSVGVFLIMVRFKCKMPVKHIFLFFGVLALVGGSWFILQLATGNYQTVIDFIVYQVRLFQTKDAGHGGFFFYHFVVLFVGVFPASVFALLGFKRSMSDSISQHHFRRWMIVLFWVVLVLFTIVKTKIVHYSSLCYFPLTFLGATVLYKMQGGEKRWPKWINVVLISLTAVYAFVLVGLQLTAKLKEDLLAKDLIKDRFAAGNLQADVAWGGYEFLVGFVLMVGVILALVVTKKPMLRSKIIFSSGILFMIGVMWFFVGRIEGYSQRAALEFLEEHSTEDCYQTTYHRSYAPYFYGKLKAGQSQQAYSKEWLMQGNISKPVYFVVKNVQVRDFKRKCPEAEMLYEKNGFVFFKRGPRFF